MMRTEESNLTDVVEKHEAGVMNESSDGNHHVLDGVYLQSVIDQHLRPLLNEDQGARAQVRG